MGCKSSVIKKEIEMIHSKFEKYISREEIDNLKSDIKNIAKEGLEMTLPILENALLQKTDIIKQKQVSDLTKSFVTNTFKNVNEKLENISNKVIEIDKTKINKPNMNVISQMVASPSFDFVTS